MAISSIHIENGKPGYFAHNSREAETKNSIFSDEKNYCSCSKDEAFKIYRSELKKRKETYVNNTKQRFQGKTITYLSAILNFNKEHTQEDIKKVCDFIEKKLDTKVIQYAMHRDEGHTIEKESQKIHNKLYETVDIKNYHAHIEFMGIDSKGKSLKQKIDKPFLKQLQTDVAEILNMQRGQQSGYSKEEYKKIQEQLDPIATYSSKKAYNKAFNNVAKELGYMKERIKPAKRLDTYEYKEYANKLGDKDRELQELKKKNKKYELAKQKDLKEEVTRLRAELKQNQAIREDYARLEELNNNLKQQIKNKSLTISDFQDKIKKLESSILEVEEEKENQITELRSENQSLVNKTLELKEKINSHANMSDYNQEIKEKQNQLDEYKETFEKLDEILLTEEDKKDGKGYLKRNEIVERVSKLVHLVDRFKRAFDEFNQLLEKPKQTISRIKLTIINKLKLGKSYLRDCEQENKIISKKQNKKL